MGIKFDVPIERIIDDLDDEMSVKLTKAANSICDNARALSPVDSGRYRGAHHISQGAPSYAMSGATSISVQAGDYRNIYIQNNLPYSERIENGWSKQAPSGVYGNAVNSVEWS